MPRGPVEWAEFVESALADMRPAWEELLRGPIVLNPKIVDQYNDSEECKREFPVRGFLVLVNLRTHGWLEEVQRMADPMDAARLVEVEALAAELLNTAPEGLSDFPEVAAEAAQSFAALKLAVQDASRRITKARA